MTGRCSYPEHHAKRDTGLLAAAVIVLVVIKFRHLIAEVFIWSAVAVGLALAVALVVLVTKKVSVTRRRERAKKGFSHAAGRVMLKRFLLHLPRALWCAARWHYLTRNLGLAVPDKHVKGRVLRLRARIWPTSHGVAASVRCVPGTGREQVEAVVAGIADSWRCVRVSVSQRKPNRVVVRGMRVDPLTQPVTASVLPPWDRRHLVLGPDEWGAIRSGDLANLSGSVISGNPGRGKTESALSVACQLVPSPAVELYLMDGGGSDWAPFVPAAVAACDDSLADAEELLLDLHSKMMARRRNLVVDTGYRNGWKAGPSEAYPLRWLLIEEASVFFDLEAVKGDRDRERRVRACRGLAAQLLRRGRAPMHHTTLIVQKPVGAGGLPPELRDLCGLRWCFGVSTTETAVAALGDDIRQFPAMNPTLLQEPQHVGTAVALLRTGMSPYTFIRFPEIGEALADQVAGQAAARRASRAVPDDARELEVTPHA
jgi:DNA segregation ATPase FtsK/SpoIIIE, S-DNA-T family